MLLPSNGQTGWGSSSSPLTALVKGCWLGCLVIVTGPDSKLPSKSSHFQQHSRNLNHLHSKTWGFVGSSKRFRWFPLRKSMFSLVISNKSSTFENLVKKWCPSQSDHSRWVPYMSLLTSDRIRPTGKVGIFHERWIYLIESFNNQTSD